MCEGIYWPTELVEMEVEILRTLGWRLNGPTPYDFIHHFFELLPPSADKQAVKMLTERAVRNSEDAMTEYSVALEPSSHIAVASIEALNIGHMPISFYGLWLS